MKVSPTQWIEDVRGFSAGGLEGGGVEGGGGDFLFELTEEEGGGSGCTEGIFRSFL